MWYITPVLLISVVSDIGQLLSADRLTDGLIEAAKGLLSDEQSPKRRKILTDLLLNLEDRSELESREEDEDWFKGTKSSEDGLSKLELLGLWVVTATYCCHNNNKNMLAFSI